MMAKVERVSIGVIPQREGAAGWRRRGFRASTSRFRACRIPSDSVANSLQIPVYRRFCMAGRPVVHERLTAAGVLFTTVSADGGTMSAYINYHPRFTEEAGTRTLYAAGVAMVLIIIALALGSSTMSSEQDPETTGSVKIYHLI
jgi:hypothetical protein